MSLLRPLLENRAIVREMMAAWLRRNRNSGAASTLLGIGGLGLAWHMLPGFLLLPLIFGWGIDRWQYDTLATWAYLASTFTIVSWYVRTIGEDRRYLIADRLEGRAVASSVGAGVVLAAAGELLWGRSVGDGVTVLALRFDPVVDVGVVALFLGAVVLTPLVQEAFFRGVVQNHAKTAVSAGKAVIVSSTAFALLYVTLFYIGDAASMLVTVCVLFPQGCLLGYLYQSYDTILAPAIAHAIVNLYAFSHLLI